MTKRDRDNTKGKIVEIPLAVTTTEIEGGVIPLGRSKHIKRMPKDKMIKQSRTK